MSPKKNTSSAGTRAPSGSPGPVILFYPYRQGADAQRYTHHTPQVQTSHASTESVSRYLADSTSGRSRDSNSAMLPRAYADRPTASDPGGPDAGHGRNHTSHSLVGKKRQHSPELTDPYSTSIWEQSQSSMAAGPSKAPRLSHRKEKDKQKDAEFQRAYRADKNDRLRKLNSMLPKGLQCDREPPRLPPIIDNTVKYIDQLHKEKEEFLGNSGPSSWSSQETPADIEYWLSQTNQLKHQLRDAYSANISNASLIVQYEQRVAALQTENSDLRSALNQRWGMS
ncbi:hypothetical protein EVG20_g4437 [Dentipellis fragilis]|uniref:BHLH domain-containing protein n=1 Tax=Dentipellis fragilis TaxID=205917 RepID=A0A4Y9YWQ2_9AGAM|nr:hypothetical protein EVG20_g4437 [Dentipellis fragilis]